MTRAFAAALIVTMAAAGSAQTRTFTLVGSIAGSADLVEVAGSTAYIAGGKTLTLVDVSDPASPKRAGAYTFPELIWGVTVSGSTAYVAADTYGLAILDATNPASPVLRGALKTPGQAKSVALAGARALVADHVRGIDVVDISSPARPALLRSMFVDGFAKDVVTRGNLLFSLDQPNGLNVFDVSDRGGSDPIGMLTLVNPIPLRSQLDVSTTTMPRLAVVAGGGPPQIYDVSDARAPKPLGTVRTPGNAQRVSLQGTSLYVADGPAGLLVVDLSSPATPRVAGGLKLSGPARDVAVAGDLVFVVVGADQVAILRAF